MVLAVAVSCVVQVLVAVQRVQGNHAETMGEEFIGKDGGVAFDFNEIHGEGGHFGKHRAAERVRKRQVDGCETKVDAVWFRLILVSSLH